MELQAAADAKKTELNATAQAAAARQIGEAEASAIQAKGVAEGNAISAKLLAEANAIRARAEALATNQEAVIGQQLAEKWPLIVEAAAKAFDNIDQMIVLNGADGVSEIVGKVMAQGAAGLGMARSLLAKASRREDEAPPAPSNGSAVVARVDSGSKDRS